MQALAVDKECRPDILLPQGVEDELRALVGPVVEGKKEGGGLPTRLGLELGQGLGGGAVHCLGPVTLVRNCEKIKINEVSNN